MSDSQKSYTAPMPQKLSQSRSTPSASVGHAKASITRAPIPQPREPMVKTGGAAKNVDLMPSPVAEPSFPEQESGFAPDIVSADSGDDGQDRATTQPEIEQSTEKPEPVATEAKPPEGGGESDPTPGDADPGPTGGAASPGYASLLTEEMGHPRGYSGK